MGVLRNKQVGGNINQKLTLTKRLYICIMKNKAKKLKNAENQDFVNEYNKIVNSSKTSVVIESEWTKAGDNFQKLTMYDNNYTSIPTLGETTLINAL